MRASVASGGRSLSQYSQFGLSSSIPGASSSWRAHFDYVLSEDHLFLADEGGIARRFEIAREHPHAIGRVRDDLRDRAIRQRDPGAGHQRADVDRIAHAPTLSPTPSPPLGAERAGVRWGIPERSPVTPTSPSHRSAMGPSLPPEGRRGNL